MNYMEYYKQDLDRKVNRENIARKVSALIQLNAPEIIRLVRNRWRYGQSVEGGIIGRYRNSDYRQFKQSINPSAGGNVDLMLTGATADDLIVKRISNSLFQILSTNEKYGKLANKYGANEFGITPAQLFDLEQDITNIVIEELLNELF